MIDEDVAKLRRYYAVSKGFFDVRVGRKIIVSPDQTEVQVNFIIHEGPRYPRVAKQLAEQSHGSHADELETSLMLALAPHLVDMARAEASPELKQEMPGVLTPSDPNSPNYSRSGSYGDPTRATSAKGEVLLAAMLDDLHEQAAAFIAQGPGEHRSATAQSVLR